ncbi:MAG: class I SAM-dependent methyltransferase [bacterium]|nr:class I SAM-dependent methyltransferase [bacterium]
MLIAKKRIPETEEVFEVEHYEKRVYALMKDKLFSFFIRRIIKEVGFGPGKALEIGPGPLPLGLFLCRQTQWHVNAIELSSDMVGYIKKNIRRYEVTGKYSVKSGNAETIPWKEKYFNLIITSGSLHHWQNPVKVLDEIERVLAPGGTAVIFDLCRRNYYHEEEFQVKFNKIQKEYRKALFESMQAAYLPEEMFQLLSQTRNIKTHLQIHHEHYHNGEGIYNQALILYKPLYRKITD